MEAVKKTLVRIPIICYLWLALCCGAVGAYAMPLVLQAGPDPLEENLKHTMQRFVQEAHPMGSAASGRLASDLQQTLVGLGWQVQAHHFTPQTPFPGTVRGRNIVAHDGKQATCAVLLGGHYDTKYDPAGRFVGANDGGSSTAVLLELARLLPGLTPVAGTLSACRVYVVLFDGEEAFLPGWGDGLRYYGVEDHLYGSRAFVRDFLGQAPGPKGSQAPLLQGLPLAAVVIVDMIGHQNQDLVITAGSKETLANALLAARQGLSLRVSPMRIEDDHLPFVPLGIPILHVIDWTNIQQWHTAMDTPVILSYLKMGAFVRVLINFLGHCLS